MNLELSNALEDVRQRKREHISIVLGAIALAFAVNLTSGSVFSFIPSRYMVHITVIFSLLTLLIYLRMRRYVSRQVIYKSVELPVEFYFSREQGEINQKIKQQKSCGICYHKALDGNLEYISQQLLSDSNNSCRSDELDGKLLMYVVLREVIGQTHLLGNELYYGLKSEAMDEFFSETLEITNALFNNNIFISGEYSECRMIEGFPKGSRIEFHNTDGWNKGFFLIRITHRFGTIEIDNILSYLNLWESWDRDSMLSYHIGLQGIPVESIVSLDGCLRLKLHIDASRSYEKDFESFVYWMQYLVNALEGTFSWREKDTVISSSLLGALYSRLGNIESRPTKRST